MAARASSKPNRSSGQSRKGGGSRRRPSRRTGVVWGALVASMTGVGGLLFALHGGPGLELDGRSLPTLMATTGPDTVESILNTEKPIESGRWQAIVIHDSGSPYGTAASLDEQARRMGLKGLGHHFVIGSGNGLSDGEIFIGARWRYQSHGAHAAGKDADWFNMNAIGICLVGDGDRERFTPTQLRRLSQVVSTLCRDLNIPADRVYLHSQIAPTTSPGRLFSETAFREGLTIAR